MLKCSNESMFLVVLRDRGTRLRSTLGQEVTAGAVCYQNHLFPTTQTEIHLRQACVSAACTDGTMLSRATNCKA